MHAGKWVAALLLSVLTGPVSPVLAQSLKDLIQVNKSAGFADRKSTRLNSSH